MSEFRHIVRVAGKDLPGSRKVVQALAEIKGVGLSLAQSVVNALNIDSRLRLGQLSEDKVREIEELLKDPGRHGLPSWILNRRKDLETGADLHLIGADLEFQVKSDITREKSMGTWRGVRHALGLKVRGQRTRTTGRKGRTVGVKKAAK